MDRRKFGALSLAAACAVWIAPRVTLADLPAPLSTTLRAIIKAKRLRVGMAAGSAPFVLSGTDCDELIRLVAKDPPSARKAVDGARVVGLDVDLASALADALGVALEIHLVPTFGQIFDPLAKDDVDVAISGITRTLQRARSLSFSAPYLVSGQKLFAKKTSRFDSVESVNSKGTRIGVKRGTTGEALAKSAFSSAASIPFDTNSELFRALDTNAIAVAVADALVGRDTVVRKKVGTELHAVGGRRLTSESICMAARQGDADWSAYLSLVIHELKMSGAFHRLVRRYNPWLRVQRG